MLAGRDQFLALLSAMRMRLMEECKGRKRAIVENVVRLSAVHNCYLLRVTDVWEIKEVKG